METNIKIEGYRCFNLDVERAVKKVVAMATKKLGNIRSYTMEIVYWDDGDYQINLQSCWGGYKDVFLYKNSSKYIDTYREIIGPGKVITIEKPLDLKQKHGK